MNYHG